MRGVGLPVSPAALAGAVFGFAAGLDLAGVAFAAGFATNSAIGAAVALAGAFEALAVFGFAGALTGSPVAAFAATAFGFTAGLDLAGVVFAAGFATNSAIGAAVALAGAFEALAVFGFAEAFTELSVATFLTFPVGFFKAGAAVFTTSSAGAFAGARLVVFAGVVSFATLTSQLIFLKPARSSQAARMLLNNPIYCERPCACKYLH